MTNTTLRLRVFAGPNGSGKSTIIQAVRAYRINSLPVDFGLYINADDIARSLREDRFEFDEYEINPTLDEVVEVALASGLVGGAFSQTQFQASFAMHGTRLRLLEETSDERLAQILADYLRKKLLEERKKFSFETVFSHPSKLDVMRQAAEAGYKVYLYFVSTESPEVNKFRVEVRTKQGGHHVPPDKIESRYYRSLELLYEAAQLTYQTFFFDNSIPKNPGELFEPFAYFKVIGGEKKWEIDNQELVPNWFLQYYFQKVQPK
ncbi:zeta toxin family protein [Nibrella viscosa]|uniref:Zeta toxin family protein n=1 Tax=Nibrella viscosa TaxID=1084524 RepID=A0ABP8KZI4_9BACT